VGNAKDGRKGVLIQLSLALNLVLGQMVGFISYHVKTKRDYDKETPEFDNSCAV
jgi:hypothetical protein